MKKIVPSFRRYSEPCLTEVRDEVDCQRIPPLHYIVETNDEKLYGGSNVDCENNIVDPDEFDDEWFAKLANRNETWNQRVPPVDGFPSDGSNSTEIPLLFGDDMDFKEKTIRTLRTGMRKIWKRGSATITAADPTNKVVYLGNVLTGWAKGEVCIEKPLHTLWKNYSSSTKPDVHMKITVTQSGLKAVTKDHGLTEYWSHRITYCSAPPHLPRVFCWIYRHEGRKLKQELRCHAVLCSKESTAQRMASTLRLRLSQALSEFKRDKLLRQNARLSLANSVYDNPSLPRRKILLSIGSQNYRPPLERSKSAPKLMAIEESLEEEEHPAKPAEPVESPNDPVLEKPDDKPDFKLTNLNFVKKLCSSIENLVESTSNYGKKLLSERRCSKESHVPLKNPEDSILKKPEDEDSKRSKIQKYVKFEGEDIDLKAVEEKKEGEEIILEVKDQESDEGSNSLQSISSWSSDGSSMITTSSDKSHETKESEDKLWMHPEAVERLQTYISNCNDVYLNENEVVLHPTGERNVERKMTRLEADSLSEEEEDEEEEDSRQQEEDVVSDESGYVELTEHVVKRLSLDQKEKDIPYHRIIKSNLLRPRRFESSCLQV